MNKDYKCLPKLSADQLKQRQREYWRRWKERNAPKTMDYVGWHADFTRVWNGWKWTARQTTNGAELENGPFESLGKAKQDFMEAIG